MKNFFWIDLEMTGLNEKTDSILEIAAIVTDLELKPLDQFHAFVYQPPEVLQQMNAWCQTAHAQSGLLTEIPNGRPLIEVEQSLLNFMHRYFDQQLVVLAGNSVDQDRRFIQQHLPQVAQRLHYRVIDVSSLKEIFRNKYQIVFEKKKGHRALEDIHESIAELNYYLSFIKVNP